MYKSNAFVQFDNIIYLDRYLDSNFEALADRRKRVTASRKQLDTYKAEIAELTNNKVCHESHICQDFARTHNIPQKYAMPVAEMLEITTKILKDNQKNSKLTNEDYEQVMHLLLDEIQAVKSRISGSCFFFGNCCYYLVMIYLININKLVHIRPGNKDRESDS